jgi:hypothetical protein
VTTCGTMGNTNRATVVHDTYKKSVESYRQYLKIAERRAIELSPERKLAWQTVFRLQRLLNERQASRFEYLFGRGKFDGVTWKSLSSITERLDKGWSEAEEADLKENVSSYRDASREIEDLQSNWDSNVLGDSSRVVDQDLQYSAARRALAERTRKLQARLDE